MMERRSSNTRPLILGTLSFAVCFMAWGLISAFAPRFREMVSLSATQTALLVAVPVLLGSLARLPVGMLADRFGGRAVFTVLMLLVAAPAWLVPAAGSYQILLVIAFFQGIAGSSFPVGASASSRAGRRRSGRGRCWGAMGWAISVSRRRSSWGRCWRRGSVGSRCSAARRCC
jgi:nitrate/nitrite transporter NarK